jgi:hypothetical protein
VRTQKALRFSEYFAGRTPPASTLETARQSESCDFRRALRDPARHRLLSRQAACRPQRAARSDIDAHATRSGTDDALQLTLELRRSTSVHITPSGEGARMASRHEAVFAAALAALAWAAACGVSDAPPPAEEPKPGTTGPANPSAGAQRPGGNSDENEDGGPTTGNDVADRGGQSSRTPTSDPPSAGGSIRWMRTVAGAEAHSSPSVALNPNGTTAVSSIVEFVPGSSSLEYGTVEIHAFDPSGGAVWSSRAGGGKPRYFSDLNFTTEFTIEPWASSFVVVDRVWRDMQTHAIDFSCASHQVDPGSRSRVMFLDPGGGCSREIDIGSSLVGFAADEAGSVWYSYTIPGCAGCLLPFAATDAAGAPVLTRGYDGQAHGGGRLTRIGGVLYAWTDDIGRMDDTFAPVWRADLPGWIVGTPFPGPEGDVAAVMARAFRDSAGGEMSIVRVTQDGTVRHTVAIDATFTPAVTAGDSLGAVALSSSGEQELRLTAFDWDGSARWSRVLGTAVSTGSRIRLAALAVDPVHGVRAAGTFSGTVEIAGERIDSAGRSAVFVIALER